MEPEVSLSCSQEPNISPLETDESILAFNFVQMQFYIILPSTLRSLRWTLSFRFLEQNFVCISHLSVRIIVPCLTKNTNYECLSMRAEYYAACRQFLPPS
jgi:hypothetical protein